MIDYDNLNTAPLEVQLAAVKQYVVWTEEDYVRSEADLAKAETGHRVWKENQEWQDDFNRNPYDIESPKQRRDDRLKHFNNAKEAFEFATDTFLSMIPEDENESQKRSGTDNGSDDHTS